jgi:hypothetical protein
MVSFVCSDFSPVLGSFAESVRGKPMGLSTAGNILVSQEVQGSYVIRMVS